MARGKPGPGAALRNIPRDAPGDPWQTPPMIKFRLALLLTGALAAAACTKPSSTTPAATGGAAARDPNAAVAKIGGQVITEAELTKESKADLARAEGEHIEKVHGIKEAKLNEMVEKRLIEAKAKAEGITADKLVEREVGSKVTPPSEEQLKGMYENAKKSGQQLPPYEQIKPQIVEYATRQSKDTARRAFIDKLRADSKVEILLPPALMPKVEVAAEGQLRGPTSAPVTIVEFSDFQCPFCSRAEDTVKKVMDTYKGKVRLFYRDYPLPFHPNAQKASEAALCAGDQNKYWEMHEKLFASQSALTVPQLKDHAKGLGLDAGKFDKCLDGGDKAKVVETSKKVGEELGVNGTPHFFINGRGLSGAQPFEKFKELIDIELAGGG
jgi:protein-disulfide isomerase